MFATVDRFADHSHLPSGPILVVCVGLIVAHYALLGQALRYASPVKLSPLEATKVQWVGAVAGRFTPAGLGPAAVNVRYLGRQGVAVPSAVTTIAVMHLLHAVSGTAAFVVIAGLCLTFGWAGVDQTVNHWSRLGDSAVHTVTGSAWWLLGLAALTVAAVVGARRARTSDRLQRWATEIRTSLTDLRSRPLDVLRYCGTSVATSLSMALIFAFTVAAVPGHQPLIGLVLAWFTAQAVASAVPTPGGIGSTEAALVAAAVATGVPTGSALAAVLAYRAMTFWAPVPVGLAAGWSLRRRGQL